MRTRRLSSRGHLAAAILAVLLLLPAAAPSAPGKAGKKPVDVHTRSNAAKERLHPRLQQKVEAGSTARIPVFVTVRGNPAPTQRLLEGAHVARAGAAAIVVGTIRVQELGKLATTNGVLSVDPVELRRTGRPLGIPDPEVGKLPDVAEIRAAIEKKKAQEVGHGESGKLAKSTFEDLTKLGVLDAKTHDFAEAWREGYTGEGSVGAVLDGGTDWGHPDLIGTWKTGENGWPEAYDPYGTLIWLVAPDFVDQGLSWYTRTEEKRIERVRRGLAEVTFSTRTGPARNFDAPDGKVEHVYTFPRNWVRGDTVRIGSHPDDWTLLIYEERPAFLVVPSKRPGQYDEVYVDLDNDYSFADEKPVSRKSPVSYRDLNDDGYTDLSGGLLYYISDGETPVPGGLDAFGVEIVPEPGEILAWNGDYDPAIDGHGTLTAGNVVGQGVINGLAPCFSDLADAPGAEACDGGGTYPGAVIGGAPHAELAPFGDIYFSFDFSTQFAYFLTNRAGIDVTTNSYGASDVDNDGFDAASQEAAIWHSAFAGSTTALFSTGNGAPGFGTTAPPSPYTGIGVGASTQFGGTGWDSIDRESQIVDDDVMVWSNRGPGATGANGVDVLADGAFSAGDVTLNAIGDGRFAWNTWGGTSRSAPVAGAATLLVYEAYRDAHGSVPEGFQFKAREILKSSSEDLGYDSWVQGSGSIDAGRAVEIASSGGSISPDAWRAGDYRGEEWDVFTHVMAPGQSDSQTFAIDGGGTYSVSDRQLVRTDSVTLDFQSSPVSDESPHNFNAPDYLVDITEMVAARPDTDVMVVRLNFPYEQFDADEDYEADQAWRLLTYDWTDVNGDGNLWTDTDGDGTVDHADLPTSSNIDGFPDIDFAASEMDEGEYVRFMYHRAGANTLQSWVRDPAGRMADGLFLGLQHSARSESIPTTDFDIQIDFYENADWSWLSAPADASGSFTATVDVPADTPAGMYGGAIVLEQDGEETVIPVSVAVASVVEQDPETGKLTGSLTFGGADVADAQADHTYNNGSVFGATDWTWRAESGDWRFFFYDVPAEPAEGTLFLSDTVWDDAAPFTDLDTILLGRSANTYQLIGGSDPIGAPYILETVGASANTNIGAGVWRFDTATGGPREVVTAPAQEGLHALLQHQVNFQGDRFHVPFETTLGSASVTPSQVDITTATDDVAFDVTFEASVDLQGLEAEAFGLSQPIVTTETAQQDDPNDPSSASVKRNVTLEHAARLTVTTALASDDLDLFVVYDANGDGTFASDEIVGASTTPSSNEAVELVRPADGDYQIWVQGWSVSGSPSFELAIDPIQGNDLAVSGVPDGEIPAGTPVTIHVEGAKAMTAGEDYFGELLLGPPSAPTALSVPITVHRE